MPRINEVNELVNRLMAEGTERNPADCTECGEISVVKNECQNCRGQEFESDLNYQHSCLEDGCNEWYEFDSWYENEEDDNDPDVQITDLYELRKLNHPWTVWELGQRGLPLSQAKRCCSYLVEGCEICFPHS